MTDTADTGAAAVVPDKVEQADLSSEPQAMDATEDTTEDTATKQQEQASEVAEVTEAEAAEEELVSFRVVFAKQTHEVSFGLDRTISELKSHLEKITSCPVVQQKLMYKGQLKDEDTLRNKKFKKNAKVLLVGATAAQILQVTAAAATDFTKLEAEEKKAAQAEQQKWSELHIHKEVLKKGKPPQVVMGYVPALGDMEPLPQTAINPLYNRRGKCRLQVDLLQGVLTISTNEGQTKVPINKIQDCEAQPIEGHPGYHILGLRIGTEKSMRFFYWFPSQYVAGMKAMFGSH